MTFRGLGMMTLVAIVSSCARVPLQTAFMKSVPEVTATTHEMRTRVVQFGRQMSARIEQAADSIEMQSTDAQIRRQALLWKMHAIPATQEAVLLSDPLLGFLDAWAFAKQMKDYFANGSGRHLFGDHQPIAVQAAIQMENDAAELARVVTDSADLSGIETRLRSWATQNPIDNLLFTRASVAAVAANVLGTQSTSAVATVGNINQIMEQIAARLAFYNEYLLKEVDWRMRLLVDDVRIDVGIDTPLVAITEALGRAVAVAEATPEIIAGERVAVLEALRNERIAAMNAIDEQRIAILRAVAAERVAVLAAVEQERLSVLAAIREERIATLDAVDSMLQRAIDESHGLVDHFFWRAAQLLGGVLLVAGLGVFGLQRRRGSQWPVASGQ